MVSKYLHMIKHLIIVENFTLSGNSNNKLLFISKTILINGQYYLIYYRCWVNLTEKYHTKEHLKIFQKGVNDHIFLFMGGFLVKFEGYLEVGIMLNHMKFP